MHKELKQFVWNNVQELVEKPSDVNVTGNNKFLKNKIDEDQIIIRYKVRFVARDHTEAERINFDETFAPVARLESIRMCLSSSYTPKMKLQQMDGKNPILNCYSKKVSILQPKGFQNQHFLDHVFKLKNHYMLLKQTFQAWYDRLKNFHLRSRFTRGSVIKPCLLNVQNSEPRLSK